MYFQGNAFVNLSTDTIYPTSINTTYTTGPDDFTIEFFVKPTTVGASTQTIFYIGAPASATTYKMIGSLVVTGTSGGFNTKYNFTLKVSTFNTVVVAEILTNQWCHITIMRYGSSIYYYQNGTRMGTINLGSGIPSSSSPFTTNYLSATESTTIIGASYDQGLTGLANGFNGYLTNFRWTKGLAVYVLRLNNTITVPNRFQVPGAPLDIFSVINPYTPLQPYVAVGLLAQSSATLLTNTRSPSSTVSVQDGNAISGTYTAVGWAIA
jgi:hypothetical protein